MLCCAVLQLTGDVDPWYTDAKSMVYGPDYVAGGGGGGGGEGSGAVGIESYLPSGLRTMFSLSRSVASFHYVSSVECALLFDVINQQIRASAKTETEAETETVTESGSGTKNVAGTKDETARDSWARDATAVFSRWPTSNQDVGHYAVRMKDLRVAETFVHFFSDLFVGACSGSGSGSGHE